MADGKTIERLITPSLNGLGFRLVRVTYGGGARPVLQIMAEPLDGSAMTVDHCATISRNVSAVLDVEDPIPAAYTLEVSSPGIDRPLVDRDDYRRFAGFEARIDLLKAVDGRKRFKGRISAIDADDNITVTEDTGSFAVPYVEIGKAKLIMTDELIAASEANQLPPPEQP